MIWIDERTSGIPAYSTRSVSVCLFALMYTIYGYKRTQLYKTLVHIFDSCWGANGFYSSFEYRYFCYSLAMENKLNSIWCSQRNQIGFFICIYSRMLLKWLGKIDAIRNNWTHIDRLIDPIYELPIQSFHWFISTHAGIVYKVRIEAKRLPTAFARAAQFWYVKISEFGFNQSFSTAFMIC